MPKEVKEYACEYCKHRGFFSEEACHNHEENCIKNPVISAEWESCVACQGTGNHYGRNTGKVGYATCDSCRGRGRKKKVDRDKLAKLMEGWE